MDDGDSSSVRPLVQVLRHDLGMSEISRRLRTARERAGLSIEDISAVTKIRVAALQAIERGQFERLPGDFYARAFLRTYAREVHLPPDEIVQEYDASHPVAQPPPDIFDAGPERVRHHEPSTASPGDRARRQRVMPAAWALILSMMRDARVVVGLAVLLLVTTVARNRPVNDRRHEPGAVGTSGVALAAPVSSGAAPQAEAAPEKLILEIHPSGPIWVTGAADGNRVLYRLLAPGERVTVEARHDLSFRIGNAAAFTYAINGVPGKPLGGPDQISEFQITRENYRTFRVATIGDGRSRVLPLQAVGR
jgi:cytoskeleton protein RodZ